MDLITEVKIKSTSGLAMLAQQHSMVETQAIEQILVKKGVCTSEELKAMRSVVFANSKPVRKVTKQIDEISEEIDRLTKLIESKNKFSELMMNLLDGKDLSPEDKMYLYNSLYPQGDEGESDDD